MAIKYKLHKNHLTGNDDYAAKVQTIWSLDLEDVIEEICWIENTVGEADVRSVLATFIKVVVKNVLAGMNVNTPLANFGASVRGVFVDDEDSYDPARHQVRPRVSAGTQLHRAFRQAEVVKQSTDVPTPKPKKYIDAISGAENDLLTPGGPGRLTGERLKFDAGDPLQGVFFLAAADGSETRAEVLVENLPNKLIFACPDLPAGAYRLEVRAKVNDGEELRQGMLPSTLTVA